MFGIICKCQQIRAAKGVYKKMIIEIMGEPVAKGRPRFRIAGKFVSTYTPAKTQKEEKRVTEEIKKQYSEEPMKGPLGVWITFYFAIPKSYTKKQREELQRNDFLHTKKPDCDNLAKLYLDAMNGLVYEDDSQIQALHLRKFYEHNGEGSVHIQIEHLI